MRGCHRPWLAPRPPLPEEERPKYVVREVDLAAEVAAAGIITLFDRVFPEVLEMATDAEVMNLQTAASRLAKAACRRRAEAAEGEGKSYQPHDINRVVQVRVRDVEIGSGVAPRKK